MLYCRDRPKPEISVSAENETENETRAYTKETQQRWQELR